MNEKENFIHELVKLKSNAIALELTTYCPLNCIYCTREKVDRKNKNLELEDFNIIKEKIKGFENVVICGIGEPMVYPYIYDVISQLDKNVLLITSGTVAINFKELNKAGNLKVIVFSVDEPTEEGMKKIAENYNWNNMISNLINARKASIPVIVINCTVNKYNYHNIPKMIKFTQRNKVMAINFTLDINEEDMKDVNSEELEHYLSYTNDKSLSGKLMITSSTNSLKCMSWDRILPYITLEGKVYPCCIGLKEEFYLGNIFENTFEEIWNGERYKEFKTCDFCYKCNLYNNFKK